jgi:NADPH2:quinone reductase
MKSIRVKKFGGPEVLELEEVPTPRPDRGQLLVRLSAIGVNPVEVYIRTGTYVRTPALPYTPGSDGGGVVEEVGSDITQFGIGDRVYLSGSVTGTYAELALCSIDQVHRLPERVTFAQGAALGVPYVTAFAALFYRAKAKGNETVLVHGATGGVGLAAVQLSRAAGLTVIGTGGTEEGRRIVSENGAHYVLDHGSPGYLDRAMELTGGKGIDLILEMLANVNLGNDLGLLAKFGRVVVIGSRGTVEIDPRATMSRNASILGMTIANLEPEEQASIHAALVAGLENGVLKPVIDREFPLEMAAEAHRQVMQSGGVGKLILVP